MRAIHRSRIYHYQTHQRSTWCYWRCRSQLCVGIERRELFGWRFDPLDYYPIPITIDFVESNTSINHYVNQQPTLHQTETMTVDRMCIPTWRYHDYQGTNH